MLSGTTPLKETNQQYTVDSSSPFTDEASTYFKLRNYIKDPTEYTLLTTLPTEKALSQLQNLNPATQKHIFNAIKTIYSHVTERTPSEDKEHFFIHVAATVYYEEHTGINIKGKAHYKKAASLLNMLENSIKDNLKYHLRLATDDEQRNIINTFNKILEAHLNATSRALSIISEDKKKHLEKYQNMSKLPLPNLLSPQKVIAVKGSHPHTQFNKTPKKLSKQDAKSIDLINRGIEKIDFSSDSEEESTILISPKKTKRKNSDSKNFIPRAMFSNSIMDELDEWAALNSNSTSDDSSQEYSQDSYASDSNSPSIYNAKRP